jgi:hypothetical protein
MKLLLRRTEFQESYCPNRTDRKNRKTTRGRTNRRSPRLSRSRNRGPGAVPTAIAPGSSDPPKCCIQNPPYRFGHTPSHPDLGVGHHHFRGDEHARRAARVRTTRSPPRAPAATRGGRRAGVPDCPPYYIGTLFEYWHACKVGPALEYRLCRDRCGGGPQSVRVLRLRPVSDPVASRRSPHPERPQPMQLRWRLPARMDHATPRPPRYLHSIGHPSTTIVELPKRRT